MMMTGQAMQEGKPAKVNPTDYADFQTSIDTSRNLALGGWKDPEGNWYGGVAQYGVGRGYFGTSVGRNTAQTIVPNNIRADRFGDVVSQITDADLKAVGDMPMGKNGLPITANQIKGAALIAVPDKSDGLFHGQYAAFLDGVQDDAHLVRTKPEKPGQPGEPWTLNLSAMDDRLMPRVAPGTYSANPAASRLQAVPGQRGPAPRAPYEKAPAVALEDQAAETP
jgi:hypothetical protein